MKVGTPTDDELKELSRRISHIWRKLGRRLGVIEAALQAIDQGNGELSEKGYRMLRHWKRRQGPAASYKVLYDALRHGLVQRQDLAEMFC